MNKNIINRTLKESEYILKTKKTIREIAKVFGVSKSTVHKDLSNRLLEIDANLCNQIKQILKQHIDTRHIKGGESTRNKFLLKKNE
ncbi:MAG: sporulation transcriptional regulator SpoIIID [Bacilli bacterium]